MALLAIVCIYGSFLLVGWLAAKRTRDGTPADFMVAGRAMPLWLATASMTATWVDGGYLLGTAEGAYRSSLASGLQGGVCFGLSLVIGGLFFARRMRVYGFTTLVDPFEARFGRRWAVVLSLPAMFAELFWSAELLVALGSTFGVILGLDLATAILVSAAVVTLYTLLGGMWSVAYTDAFQLALIVIGVVVALPPILAAVGGLDAVFTVYNASRSRSSAAALASVSWWDVSIMLMLGGIPWNCYFQRVLSCATPLRAQMHSILSGFLTIALTIPPLLFGVATFAYPWPRDLAARLAAQPADALPLLLHHVTPTMVGLLGLTAIISAATSSFSASILSAGSMFGWNTCTRLFNPRLSFGRLKALLRTSIVALGVGAVLLALKVQSVQALWFFTSDLVFVLLFPQLVYALFDPKANLAGSVAAFATSLALRLGAGEPLFGFEALIPYPDTLPVKTVAAAAGMVVLPLVSRLTVHRYTPRALRNAAAEESAAV